MLLTTVIYSSVYVNMFMKQMAVYTFQVGAK